VHRRIGEIARLHADAPAIQHGDITITFGALEARANRLAHELRAAGVGPDAVVALHLPRSIDLVVAELAVLKAGGAYLPLDPAQPSRRLELMLAGSGARALVTRSSLPRQLGTGPGRVRIGLDDGAGRLEARPATPPPDGVRPGNLAYVIFTSGSTGVPKGVAVPHAALSNLCRWYGAEFALGPADRSTLVLSPGFDASVGELWPALAAGAAIVVVDDDVRADMAALAHLLRRHRVTVASLPTPLAEVFLVLPGIDDLALRVLITGGDVLRRAPRPGLPFRLVNAYGPSEATVFATTARVAPAGSEPGPIPIGRPIDGVAVRLLDGELRPAGSGEPGEIGIAGAGVARGYLGRPDLTADRYRPDPLGEPGSRLYLTGDVGRWRPDGRLQFLERADRQVKVRGNRVELDEIEVALLAHPGVRQAVVPRPEVTEVAAQARLAAYVVPESDWTGAADLARQHAARWRDAPEPAPGGWRRALPDAPPGGVLEVRASALDELGDAPAHGYDLVALDGVSDRLPGLDRLLAAIGRAVEATADGGRVFVGDVLSLPLLPALHAALELAGAAPDVPVSELALRIGRAVVRDPRLAVSPALFASLPDRLPRVAEAEVLPRLGTGEAAFRYDVVLRVGAGPRPPLGVAWHDWSPGGAPEGGEAAGATRIPNVLVDAAVRAWSGVRDAEPAEAAGALRSRLAESAGGARTPDLDGARVSWAAARPDGSIDAVWLAEADRGAAVAFPRGPAGLSRGSLASDPLRGAREGALERELRDHLAGWLPAYMVPDAIVSLDELPLTPVGKLDRTRLPALPARAPEPGRASRPATPAESLVLEIVGEALGGEPVGLDDNLLEVGANSLTVTRIAVRIAERLGVEVPLRQLIATPTPAAIARQVDAAAPRPAAAR
jgi:amino acid adenylation domain-containing protein